MDFLHLPSPSSSPKKLLWDLPEFAALDLKIHTAHAELRTLANKHAHRAAAEFVDREVEWELLEGEVFVEVDKVLHQITELYSKMRKNIKTAFNNIVRGVDFGLVHHSAHPTFQTDTPKTSTAKGARRDSASGGFGFDVRPKIVKKNSADDVTAALDNVQLTATNEKFGVSGSSVIYHIEDMGQHPVVVTGCWGSIYDMDTETRKTRDLHLIEMRDYGRKWLTSEIYNCHAIGPNLRVMFPYKNKPAVYCDELYCFSLPSVFQCRLSH